MPLTSKNNIRYWTRFSLITVFIAIIKRSVGYNLSFMMSFMFVLILINITIVDWHLGFIRPWIQSAIRRHDWQRVERLIGERRFCLQSDWLMKDAVYHSRSYLIRLLLERRVWGSMDAGATLQLAVRCGQEEVVIEMLDHVQKFPIKAEYVQPCVADAIERGYEAIALALLKKLGNGLELPQAQCDHLLLWLTQFSAYAHYIADVVAWGANIHVINAQGYTPLEEAFMQGNILAADQLVQYGARLNVDDWSHFERYTCLLHAAKKGHLALLRRLLDSGVTLDQEGSLECEGIQRAILAFDVQSLQCFIACGVRLPVQASYDLLSAFTLSSSHDVAMSMADLKKQQLVLKLLAYSPAQTAVFSGPLVNYEKRYQREYRRLKTDQEKNKSFVKYLFYNHVQCQQDPLSRVARSMIYHLLSQQTTAGDLLILQLVLMPRRMSSHGMVNLKSGNFLLPDEVFYLVCGFVVGQQMMQVMREAFEMSPEVLPLEAGAPDDPPALRRLASY